MGPQYGDFPIIPLEKTLLFHFPIRIHMHEYICNKPFRLRYAGIDRIGTVVALSGYEPNIRGRRSAENPGPGPSSPGERMVRHAGKNDRFHL